MENIECFSPDKKHKAILKYISEIRFGPAYYSLLINNKEIKDRIFGGRILFSKNSVYLATEEWLTTDYAKGPITRVFLFDVVNQKVSEFKVIEKGFTRDFRFDANLFIYTRDSVGKKSEVEVDLTKINNWKPLNQS